MSSSRRSNHPITTGLVAIALLSVIYILVYQLEPFSTFWNDVYLNLAIVIPAIVGAFFAAQVVRQFQPGEPPRQVWKYFALGLGCWTCGEALWSLTYFLTGDVPTPSVADIFWLVGMPLFTVAFVLQYRLVYGTPWAKEASGLLIIFGAVLVASTLGTYLLHQGARGAERTWGQSFLDIFYAVTDLAFALAGLGLTRAFGRGMWGRVWLALLVMALSDALYSWATFSGIYALSVETGNLLSLVIDLTYTLAYMLLALTCYLQYLLVRYGPTLAPLPGAD